MRPLFIHLHDVVLN